MIDQLGIAKLVADRLERAGIAYMVTGSMAVTYYAEPRFTRDVDLVVDLAPDQAESAIALFGDDFYADADALRAAIDRHSMTNVIHQQSAIKVDLIVRKATPYHIEEFARRQQVVLEGQAVWMVTPEDLVLSKLDWLRQGGSDVHRRDIASVLGCRADLDRSYIDKWTPELGVRDLWQEIGT
jgi:hypothetical protein